MAKPDLSDYIDVAERIREFKAKYPEGSLQSWEPPRIIEAGNKTFVIYAAAAYRTPDDTRPGVGYAWEPVPGPNSFTKDSELQNAETSAWGRAIVALGFETKHIASANEVRNRQPEPLGNPERLPGAYESGAMSGNTKYHVDGQLVSRLLGEAGFESKAAKLGAITRVTDTPMKQDATVGDIATAVRGWALAEEIEKDIERELAWRAKETANASV